MCFEAAAAAPWKQSTWEPQSLEKWCCPTQMLLLGVARSGRAWGKGRFGSGGGGDDCGGGDGGIEEGCGCISV